MSAFKETISPEKNRELDRPVTRETDTPRLPHNTDIKDNPFSDSSDVFNEAFKKFGLTVDASEKKASDTKDSSEDKDYSDYLEKGEDGKYYDKETGKAYDSIEAWEKAQETLAKRYEGAARYFEEKAKKEWARFKNAEENGESDAEKWEHYRRSQEYYAKAKECKEKADRIREKLGQTEKAEKPNSETNLDDNGKDDYGKPYRNERGEFLPNNTFSLMGYEYETDENGNICKADGKEIPDEHKDDHGKTYRNPDGGYIPNNTFELNGHTYETDDSSNICKIDGKEVPESCKDDLGNVYKTPDGALIPNNSYVLDGILHETDDNGEIYTADGKYYNNDSFVIGGTRYFTDDEGNPRKESENADGQNGESFANYTGTRLLDAVTHRSDELADATDNSENSNRIRVLCERIRDNLDNEEEIEANGGLLPEYQKLLDEGEYEDEEELCNSLGLNYDEIYDDEPKTYGEEYKKGFLDCIDDDVSPYTTPEDDCSEAYYQGLLDAQELRELLI